MTGNLTIIRKTIRSKKLRGARVLVDLAKRGQVFVDRAEEEAS